MDQLVTAHATNRSPPHAARRLRAGGHPMVPLDRFTLHGLRVDVANSRDDIATPHVVERLDAALAVLATWLPRRLARMRRDVAYISVERFPCRGAYDPQTRAIITELTFLANPSFTAAQHAASIVHEATHARVHAWRGRMRQDTLPREERLCREAELELGRALPPELAGPVLERALASLALSDQDVAPTVDWSEAARRVAEVDASASG
ncbi:MAG: hypothetical protein MUE41_00280 [Gemmatimonadaceae bacterium]|nr:hypothetical protein [Gemmatimonadaceae bacterium]